MILRSACPTEAVAVTSKVGYIKSRLQHLDLYPRDPNNPT